MKILAIDTSTSTCSVALKLGDKIFIKEEKTPSKQAEKLFYLIEKLLEDNNLSYNDLDLLSCTIGPGSFTGIRIGMAATKGIAIATNLPMIGITTLETIAWQAAKKCEGNITAIINAMREQVYTQKFLFSDSELHPSNKPSLIDVKRITELSDMESNIVTNCPEVFEREEIHPNASYVSELAEVKFKKGIISPLEPLYIRKPDAKKPKAA